MLKAKSLTVLTLLFSLSVSAPLSLAEEHDHHAHDDEASAASDESASKYHPTKKATVLLTKEVSEADGNTLLAKVEFDGRPLKDVTIAFRVPRTFGMLTIGEGKTDAAGTASVPFPQDLPGDPKTGSLSVVAGIVRDATYLGENGLTVDGGKTVKVLDDPFPREIWSPKTDWYLLLTIPLLIGAVWSIYIFAISQLFKIRRMASHPSNGPVVH